MTSTSATAPTRNRALTVAGGLVAASVVAVALNAVVALIAHAAGASDDFQPLTLPAYATFTVLGILAGAAGWVLIRSRARRPRALLRLLVPIVLMLSLVPDLLLGADGSQPGVSWGAVAALMVMHVVVAAVALAAYTRLWPVSDTADRAH